MPTVMPDDVRACLAEEEEERRASPFPVGAPTVALGASLLGITVVVLLFVLQ